MCWRAHTHIQTDTDMSIEAQVLSLARLPKALFSLSLARRCLSVSPQFAQVLALAKLQKASLARRRSHHSWHGDDDRQRGDGDDGDRRERGRRDGHSIRRRVHERGRRGRGEDERGGESRGSQVAQELHKIWKAVTGLKEKVARSHDAALDVLAAPPVTGGVPAQVALWQKVTSDVTHSR